MREHGTKTTPVFLPADGEASWSLFPYPQGDIIATTCVHLPKPVTIELTIKPDLVLTNPIGKDGVRSWSM